MKKLFTVGFGLLILMGAIGAYLLWWSEAPADRSDTSIRSIVVGKGETGTSIAADLEDQHIIRSQLMLRLMLRSKDAVAVIQTGTYEFAPSMSASEVADVILKGPKDIWVTFPEGWRREEMADELETKLGLKYFNRDEFLKLTKDKEGMLFPDTYLFPKQSGAALIVQTMKQNFDKKYQKLVEQYGTPVQSQNEVLTLASIVAHEARSQKDMNLVAGVLMNRIRVGIAIQSDVTLQYVKGYDAKSKTWWPNPTAADKSLKSPFNTYIHKGLPPSPVCNPGADAIAAALHPTPTDFFFYLADKQGVVHFARTLEEHDANITKYLR